MGAITSQGRHEIFYKDWGTGPADRLPPRLAAERRRLGQPDAVLPGAGLSRHRPRPPRPRPLDPDRHRQRHGHLRRRRRRAGRASRPARTPSTSATRPAAARWRATSPSYGSQGRVAKAVLISAIPPVMVKSASNPGGTADRGVRRLPRGAMANRAQFYLDVAVGPVLRLQPARARRSRKASSTTGGARA